MGSSSQSPPTETTSVQTSELPDFVKGPAESYLARAQALSNQPFTTYGGPRVAPLNTFHQAALDGGRQAISTMLPGSMNVMNQFAQGAYNSPAYIHPFLGPQLPSVGMTPSGYVGSPGAGFQGYSPFPQAPMQSVGTGAGAGTGGKGGMVAAPTPVELAPVPQGLSVAQAVPMAQAVNPAVAQPSMASVGGVTTAQPATAGNAAAPSGQAQMQAAMPNQAAQTAPVSVPDSDLGFDDGPQGEIAYYGANTALDGLRNMAFGPVSALYKVGKGVFLNEPNKPYLVEDLDTGQVRWSDGQSIKDSLSLTGLNSDGTPFSAADEMLAITDPSSQMSQAGQAATAPATAPALTPDAAFEPDFVAQPATSPALMPDAFFAADQPVAQVSAPAVSAVGAGAQPALPPDAFFDPDPITQSPITVDDLITGIPGPQATPIAAPASFSASVTQPTQVPAISFPTSPAATTIRAPATFTQNLTSPLSLTPMSEAVNPSLPELPSGGLPVSAASIFLDPYETGELNPNSNISIPQLREALAQEAIAEVLAVTNPPVSAPVLAPVWNEGAGDTGGYFSMPSYGYDGYSDFGFIGDDAGDYGGYGDDLTGGFEF